MAFSQRLLIFVVLVFLLPACGLKAMPSLKSLEPPVAADGLRAIHREGEVTVTWAYPKEKLKTLKEFLVDRAVDIGGTNVQQFARACTVESQNLVCVDRDIRCGETYRYRVVAISRKGVAGAPSAVLEVRPAEPPPPPKWISFRILPDGVELSWEHSGGDVLYNVYREVEGSGQEAVLCNTAPLKSASWIDIVETRQIVRYTVRALRPTALTDEGIPSEEIVISPEAYAPASPCGVEVVVGPADVFLLWQESPERWVKGYRVYRTRPADGTATFLTESKSLAFRDSGSLNVPTVYCVTVLGPVRESLPACVTAEPIIER